MNNEKQIARIINGLKALTKADEVIWVTIKEYLNNNWNQRLKHYVIDNNQYYDVYEDKRPYLVESKSYCAKINDGIVYVFYFKFVEGDYYLLALQKNSSSNILELNNRYSEQALLSELFVYIENQFDDINPLIDLIISKSNKLKE